MNASPQHLFDRLLAGGHGQRAAATGSARSRPPSTPRCTRRVRDAVEHRRCPTDVTALDAEQRRDARALASTRRAWPRRRRRAVRRARRARRRRVGAPLARRDRHRRPRRCCGACCASAARPTSCSARRRTGFLRLRIATPWDWRRHFELRAFDVEPRAGGQPMVAWRRGRARARRSAPRRVVDGHVEVRWSHGRFCGPPEAKVYLDTPHAEVPGYFPLDLTARTLERWRQCDGTWPALTARGLHKAFGPKVAVEHVDLDVAAGSFFGIVGPNGAGKTTTLRIATGLLRPDAGQVWVDGIDVWADPVAAKARIGVLPEDLALFERLSGRELLMFHGALRNMDARVVERAVRGAARPPRSRGGGRRARRRLQPRHAQEARARGRAAARAAAAVPRRAVRGDRPRVGARDPQPARALHRRPARRSCSRVT